jgi:hypothetical protein
MRRAGYATIGSCRAERLPARYDVTHLLPPYPIQTSCGSTVIRDGQASTTICWTERLRRVGRQPSEACRSSGNAACVLVVVGQVLARQGRSSIAEVIASVDALCLDFRWRQGSSRNRRPACYAMGAACRGHFRNSPVGSMVCWPLEGQNQRKAQRLLHKAEEREIRNAMKNHGLFSNGPSAPAINSGTKRAA